MLDVSALEYRIMSVGLSEATVTGFVLSDVDNLCPDPFIRG